MLKVRLSRRASSERLDSTGGKGGGGQGCSAQWVLLPVGDGVRMAAGRVVWVGWGREEGCRLQRRHLAALYIPPTTLLHGDGIQSVSHQNGNMRPRNRDFRGEGERF